MAEDRIRNQVTGYNADTERIAQEEEHCWAVYNAQKKVAEEKDRLQYEKDMAAYLNGSLQPEDAQESYSIDGAGKDRNKRSSRRKNTRRKNKALKKSANTASKSLRKKTNAAEAEGHQDGKASRAVKRCENIMRSAEKRKLV